MARRRSVYDRPPTAQEQANAQRETERRRWERLRFPTHWSFSEKVPSRRWEALETVTSRFLIYADETAEAYIADAGDDDSRDFHEELVREFANELRDIADALHLRVTVDQRRRALEVMVERGATEGERDAARRALERLKGPQDEIKEAK